jgi:hypothetical protein
VVIAQQKSPAEVTTFATKVAAANTFEIQSSELANDRRTKRCEILRQADDRRACERQDRSSKPSGKCAAAEGVDRRQAESDVEPYDLPVVVEDTLLELTRDVAATTQIAMANGNDLRQKQIEHRQSKQ